MIVRGPNRKCLSDCYTMAESVKSFDSSIDLLEDCSEAYSNVVEGKADPKEALKNLAEKARLQREKQSADKEKTDKEKKRKRRQQKREREESDRSLKLVLDLLKANDAEDDDVEIKMMTDKLAQLKSQRSSIEHVNEAEMALDTLQAENSNMLIQLVMMNLAETRKQGLLTEEQAQEIKMGLSHNDRANSEMFAELMKKIEELEEKLDASGNRRSAGFWASLRRLFTGQ